ncbi:MAG: O-acetyl-ADP-ribose deacetylase [Myxococcota bacterium]
MRITIVQGDITTQKVDAIVNAANELMLGGSGVDGAIHRAAGPELFEACRSVPEVEPSVRCPIGEARITPGFALPARYVIHTVGPRYRNAPDDPVKLASAFRSSLELAEANGLSSIAFPAISCGAFRFPKEAAAAIAARVVREKAWALEEVRFVLFDDELYEIFRDALHPSS